MEPIVLAEVLQQNNYVAVAIAAAVGYDYVLTFPSEVAYMWSQPWTWVSFLFILVRYLGCCCAIAAPFYRGTTLVSAKTCVPFCSYFRAGWLQSSNRSYAMYTLTQFAFLLFLGAADMVMMLRVWAMYNRSRIILGVLLIVYIPEIVLTTVVTAIASTPKDTVVVTVLGRSYCLQSFPLYHWIEDALIPLIPAAVTCFLVVVQFVRQSFQMHRATKQWQLNRYMNLLSREGIIYFLVTLLFGLVNLHDNDLTENTWWYGLLSVVSCVPVFTLTPRFILSVRKLYVRDVRSRCSSCEIDTGFGLSSSASDAGGRGTAIVFADAGWEEEAQKEGESGMPMEEGEGKACSDGGDGC